MPNGYVTKLKPPDHFRKLIILLSKNDLTPAVQIAWSHLPLRDEIMNLIPKAISSECDNVRSFMRGKNLVDDLKTFSVAKIEEDLKKHAPFLYAICTAVAFRPSILSKNTQKTEESLKPSLVNAIGTLFFIRSRNSDLIPVINSVILRRGGANKKCFMRLNHLGVSLNYK